MTGEKRLISDRQLVDETDPNVEGGGKKQAIIRIVRSSCVALLCTAALPLCMADSDAASSGGASTPALAGYLLSSAPSGTLLAPSSVYSSASHPFAYREIVRTGEQLVGPAGVVIRYSEQRAGLAASTEIRKAQQQRAEWVRLALTEVHQLLHRDLGVPALEGVEVILTSALESNDSQFMQGVSTRRPSLILLNENRSSAKLREEAIVQYARAALRETHLNEDWIESYARWASVALSDPLSSATRDLIDSRLQSLREGMLHRGSPAGSQVAWLAYVSEAHGVPVVRALLRELDAAPNRPIAAMDRALQGAVKRDLQSELREFHLWALLVGEASDGNHYSFASELSNPQFASRSEGLPALSVLANPAISRWGADQAIVLPESNTGGLSLQFEGEYNGKWQADVVVQHIDGSKRRLALELIEGSGAISIPLQNTKEVWLLVRNVGGDARSAQYTFTALHEPDYPVRFADLSAAPAVPNESQQLISWATDLEQDLVGFLVLRRTVGGSTEALNSIWVPAIGNARSGSGYHFLDQTAESDLSYEYVIQAITREGMTVSSEPFESSPASR